MLVRRSKLARQTDSTFRPTAAGRHVFGKLLVVSAATTAALAMPLHGVDAAARTWQVDTSRSHVTVHVSRAGLLSAALHDHYFVAERWNGSVTFDPQSPERVAGQLTFAADSLRDHQRELSPNDVRTVETQTRSATILDAARFPEIRFVAQRITGVDPSTATAGASGSLRGTVVGTLTLHGQTRNIQAPVQVEWSTGEIRARGQVAFRQSDYGIRPFSRALGSIAVLDVVHVDFDLQASSASSH